MTADAHPDKPMLKFGDTSLSYRQVDAITPHVQASTSEEPPRPTGR